MLVEFHSIMKWFLLEGAFNSHLVHPSALMSRDIFNLIRLLRAPSRLTLNVFRDEALIPSLGNLLQCVTTLRDFDPNRAERKKSIRAKKALCKYCLRTTSLHTLNLGLDLPRDAHLYSKLKGFNQKPVLDTPPIYANYEKEWEFIHRIGG